MEKGTEAGLRDIRRYEEILVKDPSSFCFAPLSDLYRRLGRLDDALDMALRGCEMHPDYIGGYMALGRACFEKGLYDESRQALEKVVRVMPDNALAHQLLDEIELRAAEVAQVNAPDTLSWGEPADVVAAGSAGHSDAATEEFEVELDGGVAEEIIDLTDELVEIAPVIDVAYEVEELPPLPYDSEEDAEMPVAEVIEPPASPLSTATIADLYLSQGFHEKALGIYRELLAGDPGNEELRQRIEEVELIVGHNREELTAEPEEAEVASSGIEPEMLFAEAAVEVGEKSAEPQMPAHEQPTVLETLEGWLANIRRLR